MLRDVVWIKTYPDQATAEGVSELLRSHSIECVVSDDPGRVTYRVPAQDHGFRLGVRADDVRTALEILWSQGTK